MRGVHINDSFGFATARSDVIQWVDPVLGCGCATASRRTRKSLCAAT
jgi:hypothetical protein